MRQIGDILEKRRNDLGFSLGTNESGKGFITGVGSNVALLTPIQYKVAQLLFFRAPFEIHGVNELIEVTHPSSQSFESVGDSNIRIVILGLRRKIDTLGIPELSLPVHHGLGYFGKLGDISPDVVKKKREICKGAYFFYNLGMLWSQNSIIYLRNYETKILHRLLQRPGVTQHFQDIKNIKVHISYLRSKLEKLHNGLGRHIRSNHGLGYYWEN